MLGVRVTQRGPLSWVNTIVHLLKLRTGGLEVTAIWQDHRGVWFVTLFLYGGTAVFNTWPEILQKDGATSD
jgi:hypothetical protein